MKPERLGSFLYFAAGFIVALPVVLFIDPPAFTDYATLREVRGEVREERARDGAYAESQEEAQEFFLDLRPECGFILVGPDKYIFNPDRITEPCQRWDHIGPGEGPKIGKPVIIPKGHPYYPY